MHTARARAKFRAVVEYKIPGEEERRRETNERKGAQGQGRNGIHVCVELPLSL
jgi:hypothetical protein